MTTSMKVQQIEVSEAAKVLAAELANASADRTGVLNYVPSDVDGHRNNAVVALANFIQHTSNIISKHEAWLSREDFADDVPGRDELKSLILDEPVDALLLEARELAARAFERERGILESHDEDYARFTRQGAYDDGRGVQGALTALRRGIELGREQ